MCNPSDRSAHRIAVCQSAVGNASARRKPALPRLALLASTAVGLIAGSSAHAACTFAPTAGNDTHVCDSGTSGGFTDLGGNNILQMPSAGSGTIAGNVVFGGGVDRVEIDSGTVSGNINQGGGSDVFIMTGGTIGSLNQGNEFDTFVMSGGWIVDFFDDGDEAIFTGGRIGRVNMMLADNRFDMSGGTIDRNLVTGFGNDTIILSGGTIGGNISVSGGNDSVTVTGGIVGGNVTLSFGTDTFAWNGGGVIRGTVDLGAGDDTAVLSNLTSANLGETDAIAGGLGTDGLILSNVVTAGIARLQEFETISAENRSALTFDADLTLGDSVSGTGTLEVDATSLLYGGGTSAAISAFTASQFANVVNAGTIALTDGSSASDSLRINGNYTGIGGLLLLDTALGDDTSLSDRLVISGGSAAGTTHIGIVNLDGTGAQTVQDGIMVVEAINGANAASGAFTLNGRVAAGAYEYFLFKGGVTSGTTENFYLRSTLVVPVEDPSVPTPEIIPTTDPVPIPELPTPEVAEPDPDDPETVVTVPQVVTPEIVIMPPTEGMTPPTTGATPVLPVDGQPVPLLRLEVPTYAAVPPVAQYLALSSLGTFHERRGEQTLLDNTGALPATWGRVFGQSIDAKWSGTVDPGFDGSLFGFQAGQDLVGWGDAGGHRDRIGLFVGHAHASGDVTGQAVGWNNLDVGDIDVDATSLGGYWTHIGPSGWYLDAVFMGTWFDGNAASNGGTSIGIDGTGLTASLEGGYPIALSESWTLEPQAQLVWQSLSLDSQTDAFSDVRFDSDDTVTGRLGLRLEGNLQDSALRPYMKIDLWHAFDSDQRIGFGGDPVVTRVGGTALEIGGGVVAKLGETTSVYATAGYTTNLGGERTHVLEGNIGLRINW
jgi:outer membrane autotransporter protein